MLNVMRNRMLLAVIGALPLASAHADLVFRLDDQVFVNGKTYTREEWDRMRNDPQARPAPERAAPAVPPAEPQTANVQARHDVVGPRAAACRTTRMYDEFPDADERFACGANLGNLTREEILQTGWKIDLIEKIPAPAGAPATSPRGLPLNSYNLILSR